MHCVCDFETPVQTPGHVAEMEQEREREVAEEEQTESLPMSRKEQELEKTRTFFLALEVSPGATLPLLHLFQMDPLDP